MPLNKKKTQTINDFSPLSNLFKPKINDEIRIDVHFSFFLFK